jgi:hypothetical protein
MIIASVSSFLGTAWFMGLVAVGGFVAGMCFKDRFMKMISRGK